MWAPFQELEHAYRCVNYDGNPQTRSAVSGIARRIGLMTCAMEFDMLVAGCISSTGGYCLRSQISKSVLLPRCRADAARRGQNDIPLDCALRLPRTILHIVNAGL